MPWYKQFWPWFLIALPASVVVASIITIFIALADPDGLVLSDYYRAGLAINQDLARQRAAEQLGLSGELTIDKDNGKISLQLRAADALRLNELNTVAMQLIHPTRAQKDLMVTLHRDRSGRLSGLLHVPEQQRWRIQVEPRDGTWRLSGSLYPADETATSLSPG
jgi:hypothetical protein